MNAETTVDIQVTRHVASTPDEVFDLLLHPDQPGTSGEERSGRIRRRASDPHIGGVMHFVDSLGGVTVEHTGHYLEIDRPELLVFTLSAGEFLSRDSRVIIELSPEGTGCRLALTHVGVKPEHARLREQTWISALGALAGGSAPLADCVDDPSGSTSSPGVHRIG